MAREEQKEDTALRWFRIAADEGDAASKVEVAHALMDSDNPSDQSVVYSFALDAASAGISEGQALLGTVFHEGIGVSRSPEQAFRWFRAAAVQQHAGAAAMLGVGYDVGAGCPVDKIQAAKWILRAAALQSPIAAAYWPRLARELTPQQVEEAKELAKRPFSDDDA
jgi:TPR repeat protein